MTPKLDRQTREIIFIKDRFIERKHVSESKTILDQFYMFCMFVYTVVTPPLSANVHFYCHDRGDPECSFQVVAHQSVPYSSVIGLINNIKYLAAM